PKLSFFFLQAPSPHHTYTLSLHDALPISCWKDESSQRLQPAVNRINCLLQIINVRLADTRNVCADKLRRQIPAKCEKILLNTLQNLPGLCILYNRAGQSYL